MLISRSPLESSSSVDFVRPVVGSCHAVQLILEPSADLPGDAVIIGIHHVRPGEARRIVGVPMIAGDHQPAGVFAVLQLNALRRTIHGPTPGARWIRARRALIGETDQLGAGGDVLGSAPRQAVVAALGDENLHRVSHEHVEDFARIAIDHGRAGIDAVVARAHRGVVDRDRRREGGAAVRAAPHDDGVAVAVDARQAAFGEGQHGAGVGGHDHRCVRNLVSAVAPIEQRRRRLLVGRRLLNDRRIDELQRGGLSGAVRRGDRDVVRIDQPVAIEVVGEVDGCRIAAAARIVLGRGAIGRVDDRIVGLVARLADRIAVVEDVVSRQTGARRGLDRNFQPLTDNGAVGPDQLDACRAVDPGPEPKRDLRSRRSRPALWVVGVAHAKPEVGCGERVAGQARDIDHHAVDAAAVAGVIGEGGRIARKQRRLAGGNRRVVRGIRRRIVAVETRVVVKELPTDDVHRHQVLKDRVRGNSRK